MQIRIGFELVYECPQPTPMILTLNVHFSRVADLVMADHVITSPPSPITGYRDGFGNWCSRIVAPQGQIRIASDALINDSGQPDTIDPNATARPTGCRRRPGRCSGRRHWAGRAFRRSVTTCTTTSPSATSMPG